MARILIIEDERDIREVLEYNLRANGFEVAAANDGRNGLRMAFERRPDLVLLDVMLPDLTGIEICRTLRESAVTHDTPVIMLTARHEEIDRVAGFEVGADDYVTKPFSVRELVLRIRVALRRGRSVEPRSRIEFGNLVIDTNAHRVEVEGITVELTSLEFKLLTRLYAGRDSVLGRDALLCEVWGLPPDITTRTVDTHVKRLREKLGIAGKYIETVRGVGYRFAAAPEGSSDS